MRPTRPAHLRHHLLLRHQQDSLCHGGHVLLLRFLPCGASCWSRYGLQLHLLQTQDFEGLGQNLSTIRIQLHLLVRKACWERKREEGSKGFLFCFCTSFFFTTFLLLSFTSQHTCSPKMVWLILTVMLKRWASVKCSNRKR